MYFGDAGSPGVLHSVGAHRASCAVITLDTPGPLRAAAHLAPQRIALFARQALCVCKVRKPCACCSHGTAPDTCDATHGM